MTGTVERSTNPKVTVCLSCSASSCGNPVSLSGSAAGLGGAVITRLPPARLETRYVSIVKTGAATGELGWSSTTAKSSLSIGRLPQSAQSVPRAHALLTASLPPSSHVPELALAHVSVQPAELMCHVA